MLRILGFVVALLSAALVSTAETAVCAGPEEILQLGSDRNSRALAQMRNDCLSTASPSQEFLIYLASYMVEPDRFKAQFVRTFPVEQEDWPVLSGVPLNRYFKIPYEFFLARELVSIAKTGDREALQKLIRVSQEADGAWAEILLGGILECLVSSPSAALQELKTVNPTARESLLVNAVQLELLAADAPRLIAAVRGSRLYAPGVADQIERVVASEMRHRDQ